MAVPVDAEESLAAKFAALFPHLDERQRRLVMGAEARVLGHGGIKVVAAAADVSAVTVSRGVAELEGGGEPLGRARRPGGGRKRVAGTDPGLKDALLALVDPESRGDPESPLRWTTKSTRHLAAALTAAGHPVSAPTVAALLKEESFSLQGNVKTLEGARHADRDAQFRYINAQARDHIGAGDPVISVDAKKKENVGPFKKGGAEWQPKGAPEPVNVHDFIDKELGKVTPYGVYDVAGNAGWVSVGTDHDTAAFAVATIRTWWDKAGQAAYPDARRLLITADGGGSNGYRTRLWKTELAAFAAETGLQITVCHLPPGTSKWNKIEHRLFSHISMNWRGRPLTSHEVIVNTIAATTTRTGLTVSAELDTGDYPKGIKISDREIQNLEKQNVLRRHDFHGEWNYCLDPPLPPPETSVLFICGRLAGSIGGRAGSAGTRQSPNHATSHDPGMMNSRADVVVVGSGVIGLTTAVLLAEAGWGVRVLARDLPADTTSAAAGAMWGPYLVEPRDRVHAWAIHSLRTFTSLAGARSTGVRLVTGIEASRTITEPPEFLTMLDDVGACGQDELPAGFTIGWRYTVPLIDMDLYLPYLQARLTAVGGTLHQHPITDLGQAASQAPIVVDETGLGARDLVGDADLTPIRGQLIDMDNPGITEFFTEDTGWSPDLLHLYPHGDRLIVGGVAPRRQLGP